MAFSESSAAILFGNDCPLASRLATRPTKKKGRSLDRPANGSTGLALTTFSLVHLDWDQKVSRRGAILFKEALLPAPPLARRNLYACDGFISPAGASAAARAPGPPPRRRGNSRQGKRVRGLPDRSSRRRCRPSRHQISGHSRARNLRPRLPPAF